MAEEKNEITNDIEEAKRTHRGERRKKRKEREHRRTTALAFVMAAAMVVAVTAVGVYVGFFSTGASKKLGVYIDEYLESAYTVVLQRVESLAIRNGLPSTVYEDVLTKDRMKVTLESFVNDLADRDSTSETITDDISEAIIQNTRLHLKSTGVEINGKVDENINLFAEQCVKIYQNTLVFSHFKLIRQLRIYLFYTVLTISVICVAVIAICLVSIKRYLSRTRQLLRYLIYAVGTSCIMTFVPSFLIYHRIIPVYLSNMQLRFQSDLIMNYFYNSFRHLMIVSVVLFAIYLILLGIWYYFATTKRKHI